MSLENMVVALAQTAKKAARILATVPTHTKNQALLAAAQQLRDQTEVLIAANAQDVARGKDSDLSAALLDRLTLNQARIEAMATGLEIMVDLLDPIEETVATWKRPNGLEISQVRVPLGVVGIIYESRPNVTADAAGLCLKAGNAVVLKGGSEAFTTNSAIVDVLTRAFAEAGLPDGGGSTGPFD